MKVLAAMRELEDLVGKSRAGDEMVVMLVNRGALHLPERCRYCKINGFGDWEYCEDSEHHPSHPRHMCPLQQDCTCVLDSE